MKLSKAEIDRLAAGAVEVLHRDSASALLLLCEHAGNGVPAPWGTLGLDPVYFTTHYAFDPGSRDLTRAMADRLQAPAVLSRYSRMFLDYNRYPEDWDRIRPDLGGIPVPGNMDLTESDRDLRQKVAADPMGAAIAALLPGRAAAVSIHTFTPVMAGHVRPVDIGLLWKVDSPFMRRVIGTVEELARPLGLRVGENEPYDWRLANGYCLETHAMGNGLPCACIEVNNALFSDPETVTAIAGVLSDALKAALEYLEAA
ncbi:N-formylglutamate amidohydrolase [Chachezhania sediminis]|uniref:N-formylglutamate amidohydrolase n=1 Tax=Chachezhania sediminis TaxID=2599291 RepID=UPI00131B1749|nr:N-formylglutamate amidohydrolase [Chachezhania sediminis]